MTNSPFALLTPKTTEETLQAGAALARAVTNGLLQPGDIIQLKGDLGAGKSTFMRGLIRALLGAQTDVPSPTFALVHPYDTTPPLWHMDLYRLEDPEDLWELGIEEAFEEAICFIEWPEKAGTLLPEEALSLEITTQKEHREIGFFAQGAGWLARINAIKSALGLPA